MRSMILINAFKMILFPLTVLFSASHHIQRLKIKWSITVLVRSVRF